MNSSMFNFRKARKFDPETVSLLARFSVQPSLTRKALINQFIVGIKADLSIAALSEAFDCLWFFAAHDSQAATRNWVQDAHNCAVVNVPTFTVDRGYTGASTKYLNSNYNPSIDGVRYTLTHGSAGIYSRTNVSENNIDMGCAPTAAADASCYLAARTTTNVANCRVNSATTHTPSSSDSRGLLTVGRLTATQQEIYKNGALLNSAANNSTILVNIHVGILCRFRNADAPELYSTKQLAFAFIGQGLGVVGQGQLFTRVKTFLGSIGAGVV